MILVKQHGCITKLIPELTRGSCGWEFFLRDLGCGVTEQDDDMLGNWGQFYCDMLAAKKTPPFPFWFAIQ